MLTVVVSGTRRRALLAALGALGDQVDPPPFDVVVVLDGPDPETAATIARRPYPFGPMLLEQSRRGLHHARDLGASAARSELLVFADENAIAAPRMLADLHAAHREGATVLQPAIDVDSGAPATVVAEFVRRWAARRRSRLADGPLRPPDLCASPLSMTAGAYRALREYVGPPGFSRPGIGEDFRIGHALNALGIRAEGHGGAGCSLAVGETLADVLAQSHEIGRADAALVATAPETAASVAEARAARWPTAAAAERLVDDAPARAALDAAHLCAGLLAGARRGVVGAGAIDRLELAVALAYWLGHRGHDRPPNHLA